MANNRTYLKLIRFTKIKVAKANATLIMEAGGDFNVFMQQCFDDQGDNALEIATLAWQAAMNEAEYTMEDALLDVIPAAQLAGLTMEQTLMEVLDPALPVDEDAAREIIDFVGANWYTSTKFEH